jgi:hypothetical protein
LSQGGLSKPHACMAIISNTTSDEMHRVTQLFPMVCVIM